MEIETKFVEIALGTPEAEVSENKVQFELPLEKIEGVFSDSQFQVVIRALNQKRPGSHVGTASDDEIEAIGGDRDRAGFSQPIGLGKNPDGAWKPKEFESKNVGVTLEVEPEIKADGTIKLRLKPSVVSFSASSISTPGRAWRQSALLPSPVPSS